MGPFGSTGATGEGSGVDEWLTLGQAVARLRAQPHPVPVTDKILRGMADRGMVASARIGTRGDRHFRMDVIDTLKEDLWRSGAARG